MLKGNNSYSKDIPLSKSYAFSNAYHRNRQLMRVKPIMDIFLSERPEHDEICSIVWTGGKRKIKYINRACPYHRRVECIIEPVY
jgi:hypothetical protein